MTSLPNLLNSNWHARIIGDSLDGDIWSPLWMLQGRKCRTTRAFSQKRVNKTTSLCPQRGTEQVWTPEDEIEDTQYLLWVGAFLHELCYGHAARALPLVGGQGRLRGGGWAPLGARGSLRFFPGLFSSSGGEVGPLAGNRKGLLVTAGQNRSVYVPAAAPVGGALLINSIALDETLHLYSNQRGKGSYFKWT